VKDDPARKSEIARETWIRISDGWVAMTGELTEAQVISVRKVMSDKIHLNQELKTIEQKLSTNQPLGEYARLCARYMKIYGELIRLSVIEVRFGIKK
jgi:hypothetical protein